jgi:myosin heavy subunit
VKAGIQMGKTKVFVKRRAFDLLESLRGRKKAFAATKLAAAVRMFLDRLHLIRAHPELQVLPVASPENDDTQACVYSDVDHCCEAYESSLAIAVENARRNSRRSSLLNRKVKNYKWIQIDGRWIKNMNFYDP